MVESGSDCMSVPSDEDSSSSASKDGVGERKEALEWEGSRGGGCGLCSL